MNKYWKKSLMYLSLILAASMVQGCAKEPAENQTSIETEAAKTSETAEAIVQEMPSTMAETEDVTEAEPVLETEPIQGIQFPCVLESGLTIDSFFQYTGINPDDEEQEGTDIGSLQITNTSDSYLESAQLDLTLGDGTVLHFQLQDIPEDATVYAFETSSVSCTAQEAVTLIQEEVKKGEGGMLEEQLAVQMESINITLTNQSGSEMSPCTVTYHNAMEGILFGGISYSQKTESMKKGQSTELVAGECFLGEAQLVHITTE